jgi:hypothetical protein
MRVIGTSSRRDFLLAAGLGAAAAATAIGTGRRTPFVAGDAAPRPLDGYRASPHVMKYYQTTEV